MNDDPFLEAVEALQVIGRTVEPTGDDLGLWLVYGHELHRRRTDRAGASLRAGRGAGAGAVSALHFPLPLRIKATEESVQVVDRAGRVIFYVYVCAEPERRMNTKRLSPEEGVAVAQIAARALTDRVERGE